MDGCGPTWMGVTWGWVRFTGDGCGSLGIGEAQWLNGDGCGSLEKVAAQWGLLWPRTER
jgi:hypothetical protein